MNKVNYPGITYLRAICSVAVVILHSGVFHIPNYFIASSSLSIVFKSGMY